MGMDTTINIASIDSRFSTWLDFLKYLLGRNTALNCKKLSDGSFEVGKSFTISFMIYIPGFAGRHGTFGTTDTYLDWSRSWRVRKEPNALINLTTETNEKWKICFLNPTDNGITLLSITHFQEMVAELKTSALEIPMFKWTHVVVSAELPNYNHVNYYFDGQQSSVFQKNISVQVLELEQLPDLTNISPENIIVHNAYCLPFCLSNQQVRCFYRVMKSLQPPIDEPKLKEEYLVQQQNVHHRSWICDTCGQDVIAIHYKCQKCRYDLCQQCYLKNDKKYVGRCGKHSPEHPWFINFRPDQDSHVPLIYIK